MAEAGRRVYRRRRAPAGEDRHRQDVSRTSVPAILSGRRCSVDGTRNLQSNSIAKYVPLLQQAARFLCAPRNMKARSNYLCLHRFEQALHDGRRLRLRGDDALGYCATQTGDRAELADLPGVPPHHRPP